MVQPSFWSRRMVTALLLVLGSTGAALLGVDRAVAAPITSATVTIPAQSINRVLGNPSFVSSTFTGLFDVAPANGAVTLTWTSATTFHNALQAQIPGYVITDVKLLVALTATTSARSILTSNGSWTNTYSQTGTQAVAQSWNTFWGSTYRSPANQWLTASGIAYSSTEVGTRTLVSNTSVFSFSPSLVQGWISTPSSNQGLLFTTSTNNSSSNTSNVQWQITIVPEPASLGLAMLGAGCLGIASWVRRRKRQVPGHDAG